MSTTFRAARKLRVKQQKADEQKYFGVTAAVHATYLYGSGPDRQAHIRETRCPRYIYIRTKNVKNKKGLVV